jgi:hypothetical protein
MSKNLNYNLDNIKHYVRYNGWKGSYRVIRNYVDREVRRSRRSTKCKYLTFCAVQAIDVFMLELEKYIYRDEETNRLSNVYFCENDEESFSLINKMIGSDSQGFFGDFKQIILQDLDVQYGDPNDPFDEPASEVERENLRLKEIKKNMLKVFPFDVINLDMYGNFFPRNQGRYSELCQTYNEILKLQKINNGYTCNRFLMFLTVYTPIEEDQINPAAMQQLSRVLMQNMTYESFQSSFNERYRLNSTNELDFFIQFVLGFTKQIIFRESYRNGWQPKLKEIYCYDRYNVGTEKPYKISTFVVEYKRNLSLEQLDFADSIPSDVEEDYLNQLSEILINKPHIVPGEDQIPNRIKEDLKAIVDFRNDFLKKIGIYDEFKFN